MHFSDTSNQKYILYEVPKNLKFWQLISSISNFIFLPYFHNSKLVEIGHENFPKKKKVSKFFQNNPTLKMPLNMEIIYIYI